MSSTADDEKLARLLLRHGSLTDVVPPQRVSVHFRQYMDALASYGSSLSFESRDIFERDQSAPIWSSDIFAGLLEVTWNSIHLLRKEGLEIPKSTSGVTAALFKRLGDEISDALIPDRLQIENGRRQRPHRWDEDRQKWVAAPVFELDERDAPSAFDVLEAPSGDSDILDDLLTAPSSEFRAMQAFLANSANLSAAEREFGDSKYMLKKTIRQSEAVKAALRKRGHEI